MQLQGSEIDSYVEAFERKRSEGPIGDLRAFAPPPGDASHLTVLHELVRVDLEFGWAEGSPRALTEYRNAYPALFSNAMKGREIAFEEYRLRRQAGESPDVEEYRAAGVDAHLLTSSAALNPPADASATLSWAASQYWHSRATNGGPSAARAARSPHIALFRAVYQKDPAAADRLAKAVSSWPECGDLFCGFRLASELGRGAFGRVFLAYQGDLADRPVALKVVCDIRGESQKLARLQHTNIIPIYSVHSVPPFQAICMPYFGGATLDEIVKNLAARPQLPTTGGALADCIENGARHETTHETKQGQLAQLRRLDYVPAVLRIAERLADGLAHAHERGIIHRDVKPANVLLAADAQPMFLDFNMASDIAPLSVEAAQIGGTLPYMPPESLESLRCGGQLAASSRGDIYGLGLVIWELLAARHPFSIATGASREILAPMVAERKAPPDIRQVNRAVSPAFAAIVTRCLAADPLRRYSTARELHQDLVRQLGDRPLQHTPEPSLTERFTKFRRRHPRGAIAALSIAIVLPLAALSIVRSRDLAHARAVQSLADFHRERLFAATVLKLPDASPAERAEGLAVAQQAVARFSGATGESQLGWLSANEKQSIRADIGELLIVSAAAHLPAGLEQARRLNADAEPFLLGGPNERALWRQRAKIADLSNSSAEAAEFRARAEMTPATSALDRYPLIYEAWQESRLRDVIQMIREALDQDPTDIALWQVLADAHLNLDEIDLAAGALDACRVLYPDLYRTHYQRGILELRRHHPAIARNEFDLALKSQSDFFPALMQRAIASAEIGDIAGAMSDLDAADRASAKLLSRAPAQIEFMRARLLTAAGDIDGAARAKAKGLARAPVDAADWVVRGLSRIDDDPKAALGDFAEALKIDPRNRSALRNQANVLAESLDRPTDAIAVLDQLLEFGPESGQDLAGRGVVLARSGRRTEAHRDAVAALKADHRPFTRYQVAGIYALTARTMPSDALEAVRLLASAFRDGVGLNLVDTDSDLNPIRQRPEFQRVLDAARTLSEKSNLPHKPH